MNFFEIRFHSRKAVRVEMKHSMKRLQVTLLSLASLIALAEPGSPVAEKVRTFLGNKVLLTCSFHGNVTVITWSFNPMFQNGRIAALRCDLNEVARFSNNTRIRIQSASCNISNNEMNLQIEPVHLADDGNYTCEIVHQKGVHKVTFSLAVTVPPVVSFNIENRLNDTMTATCTASNGKPAAEITWHPKDLGNFSNNINHHGNRTVTVRSQYNISIHLFSEEVTCIVRHPAFDGTQNYTIPMQGPHDSQPTPDNLFHLYLVAGVLAACLGLLAVTLVILRYFDLQNQAAFRNCCISRSSQVC
ncbi:cell surface glycoprotein CD200 receptor 1-B-like isoform X2 [Scyliorhinus canicula]|uniref:cell surface glycoprotein CD200 receptor 1-B-like isoform X2 n=1 Tax=Scyliorhinus canicula TaxID=7830 RepID=UPI0018F3C28F|nr:cell surface glycoprotein CD200 receptor 1-B-like isoform X2 [Scyliorhinus canicula]